MTTRGRPDAAPTSPEHVAPIPIVIIDSQDVVHAGIKHWSSDRPLDVVGTYRSAFEFVEANARSQTNRVIVVFDPENGDEPLDFAALTALSKSANPIVVYSRTTSPEIVLRCVDYGAVSYLAKSEPRERLIDAITAVWSDRPSQSPTLAAAERIASQHGRPRLTVQEQRVMLAWLHTDSKHEVARRLHITVSTVRTHIQRIRRRYDTVGRPAGDKATLFARAIQDGFVGPREL